ncbi:MAG: hypothetical protein KGL35_07230, partial [Bradyrhizobium sp.]|nr:hypothetical protein [Bradyrhizobium sp.]
MPNPTLAVTITAKDQASGVLAQINKRLEAMSAPAKRAHKAFKQLAQNTGLAGTARLSRDMATFSGEMFRNLARAVPAAGALTEALSAAGAAAALGELMKTSAEWANQLKQVSIESGVASQDLQRIGAAAAAAGGDSQGAIHGVAGLARNIALVMHTGQGDPAFFATLHQLGISLTDASGHARTTSSVLNDILHRLAAIKDPQQRAYQGTMLLGDAYKSFARELNNGVAGLDAYQKRAAQVVIANPGQVRALSRLQGSFNFLEEDILGVGHAIAGDLAPAAQQITDQMARWLEVNHKWLEADIVNDVKKVGAGIHTVVVDVNGAVQSFGGWKTVAEALVAIKLTGWVAGAVEALSPLRLALIVIADIIEEIRKFTGNAAPKNLAAGSPLWQGIPDKEQSNYVNSPRSQAFLKSMGV